jgi:putative PIN family toxin of toxin-antitoxin system
MVTGIKYNTTMRSSHFRIVLDTNVVFAALRSRRGASFRLLSLVGSDRFDVYLSVPLLFEYEDVLKRETTGLMPADVDVVLDYLCGIAEQQEIHFLWRPCLRDPKDDMVLELAVASQCTHILTFNTADFGGVDRFGLTALWPADFLRLLGEKP